MRGHVSKPRVYVFSAYRSSKNLHQNRMNHADLSCDLALIPNDWQECEGSYKGVKEESFIVTGVTAGKRVRALARLYKQDTYLVATEHTRECYIVDCETGYHTHVGTLEYLGTDEPTCEGWTYVNGCYYSAVVKGPLVDLPEGL
jgi:hypothetical protein